MSGLFGNPEDWFSRVVAHLIVTSPLRSVCDAVVNFSCGIDNVETSGDEPPIFVFRNSSFNLAKD